MTIYFQFHNREHKYFPFQNKITNIFYIIFLNPSNLQVCLHQQNHSLVK